VCCALSFQSFDDRRARAVPGHTFHLFAIRAARASVKSLLNSYAHGFNTDLGQHG
jgi:hypothetical protein